MGREDEVKDHLACIDHLLGLRAYREAVKDLIVAGCNDP
jgi:hypothetical protein